MSWQSDITQQIMNLTERLNQITTSAKKIFELNWQSILNPASELHVTVGGQSYRINIQQILDAALSYRQNQLIEANVTVDGNDVTVDAGAQWVINNVNHELASDFVETVDYAETGYTRNDILVGNELNVVYRIIGPETEGISPTPNTPLNTVLVTVINVTDSTIGYTPPPDIGDNFEVKINKQDSLVPDGSATKYPTVDAVNEGLNDFNNRISTFSGVFDLSKKSSVYYSDYMSGAVVNLSIASSPILGSVATVRVKGNLLGTIPSDWNISGQPFVSIASKLNEITIMYVSSEDIRLVNRVVPYVDITPPSVPANLVLTSKTGTTITVSWDASTDVVGVSGYKIYVGGVYNSFTPNLTKLISGLSLSTAYSIQVSAIDAVGNESAKSTALSVTTDAVDTYETEYQAILTYATANSFDLPDTAQKSKDNLKVKYLKSIGAWTALDTVRIFNSAYSPTSWTKNMYRLNFKNPALYPLTAVGGLEPSFTSGSGFNVVGGSGKYGKTGFIPSTHGVNFTGTNASEILSTFNIPSTYTAPTWVAGGRSANNDAQILIGNAASGAFTFRLGAVPAAFNVAQTDMNAHFHVYKNSGTYKLFMNGLTEVTLSGSNSVGTTLSSAEQYLLGANDNGTLLIAGMNVGLKYHLMGSALDTLKNEIYQILNDTYSP